MYRRDISSIIRFFSVLLILFVLFQLWIKPTAPTTSPAKPAATPDPQSSSDEYAFSLEHPTPPEVPETRLLDLGDAPSAQLGQLRDNLDRGNYRDVETGLQKLPSKLLAGERAKRFVAALWNNLGVQQEKFSGVEVSVKAFKQAVALAPKNPVVLLNLTHAYWGLHDQALTPEFLESVLLAAPEDAFSHIALADALIERGNTMEATRHLRLAQARAQTDPYLVAYSERLSGKLTPHSIAKLSEPTSVSTKPGTLPSPSVVPAETVRVPEPPLPSAPTPVSTKPTALPPPSVVPAETVRVPEPPLPSAPTRVSTKPTATPSPAAAPAKTAPELPLPSTQNPPIVQPAPASGEGSASGRLAPRSKEQFAIQFDGKPDPETLMRIRAILEYAHEELSKKFGYSLSSPTKVVLHTGQRFAVEAGRPVGADELYDAPSSTIHIPTDGAMEDLAVFSRVLRHEFVHALLDDKMRGHKDRLPTWLSEGLAIQLAEDPWPALEESGQRSLTIIPLSLLEGRWDRSNMNKLDLAYVESSTAVQKLIERFGMYGIRQLMNQLQAGQSLDAVMKQKWSISYDQFQQEMGTK